MNITHGFKRALQINAEGIATIFGDRRRTWRDLGERIPRLAGGFATLGIRVGDRVAVLSLNSDRYLEAYLAAAWAGTVIVPLNIRWSASENEEALRDCRAGLLIVDEMFATIGATLARAMPGLRLLYADDGDAPPGAVHLEDLVAGSEPASDAMRSSGDLAGIFYTGGTTGRSKGVMLSHGNLMANALNALGEGWFPSTTRYLHAAPMFHLADGAATFSLLLSGGVNVMIKAFNPEAMMDAVERHKVSETLLVPTMLQMLVDHPAVGTRDLSSLKRVIYGASPISETLFNRAVTALPGTEFWQGYGMTELSPIVTILPWKEHIGAGRAKGRHRSAGRATLGCEVRIVDAGDQPMPRGSVGEIVARGDNLMIGYWERPEETASALAGGWMHTGDGGYMDDDGFVFMVDRIKDMIISGGENIYSIEVENVLAQHTAVAQCAVIGLPNEEWGEQVHAIVVSKPGMIVTEIDILAFCRERLAAYKSPRSVEIADTPLPMSGAGKILKRELRRRLER
ncbi:MAG: long-chain-fatty-acid--CoA ligase [Rhizomicrobium sp.]